MKRITHRSLTVKGKTLSIFCSDKNTCLVRIYISSKLIALAVAIIKPHSSNNFIVNWMDENLKLIEWFEVLLALSPISFRKRIFDALLRMYTRIALASINTAECWSCNRKIISLSVISTLTRVIVLWMNVSMQLLVFINKNDSLFSENSEWLNVSCQTKWYPLRNANWWRERVCVCVCARASFDPYVHSLNRTRYFYIIAHFHLQIDWIVS